MSHFTYDLRFYIDQGDAPQSLEFDVNQAFGGTRWTWGSQCDFDQTHQWNIWDPLNELWKPIPIPCNHFPSNTWIHLIWNLERVGNQVHYISLTVADQTLTWMFTTALSLIGRRRKSTSHFRWMVTINRNLTLFGSTR